MDGLETEHIERDTPETDEPIRDEDGQILSRHKDYWEWHDAIKKQLFQDT